jgi:hypothetical protein
MCVHEIGRGRTKEFKERILVKMMQIVNLDVLLLNMDVVFADDVGVFLHQFLLITVFSV